jgi:hypothetical protein
MSKTITVVPWPSTKLAPAKTAVAAAVVVVAADAEAAVLMVVVVVAADAVAIKQRCFLHTTV